MVFAFQISPKHTFWLIDLSRPSTLLRSGKGYQRIVIALKHIHPQSYSLLQAGDGNVP